MIANADIRQEAERAGIRLWKIAERYGLNDGNFSRKLRNELPAEEKSKIRSIITELKGGE
jgi:hypothetical protein